ncbi:hypothetical protein MW887_000811 [Aspergillus wentii]|nr:hypothetical protein MW887_000811 [Aspergillus wentii]
MKTTISTFLLCGLAAAATQPNILFILTDDQDKYMGSMDYMPHLQKKIVQKGTNYEKHFCSTALCCPSRANIWTGRMPHNTNVTDVGLPYGGYPKFVSAGWNDNYLPLWMQDAGYNTYYVGKLWNAFTTETYNNPPPRGFNGSDILVDPWTYQYYLPRFTRNGGKPVAYDGQYSTDVIKNKSLGFIDEAVSHKQPWMLTVAPNAPHANGSTNPAEGVNWFGEADYPSKYESLFKDYKILRDASFNNLIEGAVSWTAELPKLNQTEIDYNDEFQRKRLRALQGVDELIDSLITKLDTAGVLDNTYIFFAADNGYHISQHRMRPGKNCGFDTDINVPLAIRGPGIPENQTLSLVTSHTDLAPTFLSIAGATKDGLDGKKIPWTANEDPKTRTEHAAIEYWSSAIAEGKYGWYSNDIAGNGRSWGNNTYKGVRLVADDYALYYSVWCTNEKEFYNTKADPAQTVNLAANTAKHADYKIANRGLDQIIPRLDALMMVLKSCTGDACRDPWKQLHPGGKVQSLPDALDASFDGFYSRQPKVSFSSCEPGYLISREGPQKYNVYGGGTGGGKSTSGGKRRSWFGWW